MKFISKLRFNFIGIICLLLVAGIFCIYPSFPSYAIETLDESLTGTTRVQTNIREPGTAETPEELQELNDLISPLILKGQPLSHIFAVHSDEIPVCRRTLYNYLDQRVFQARNIDLPRRVRYKKRKKK